MRKYILFGFLFLFFFVLTISLFVQPRTPPPPLPQRVKQLPLPTLFGIQKDLPLWENITLPSFSSPPSLKQGETLYQKYCSLCHGKEGKGDGDLALYLRIPPTNLRKGPWKFTSHLGKTPTLEDLYRSITAGFPPHMPSFRHLSPKERYAIAFYVKSWLPKEKKRPIPYPSHFPTHPKALAKGEKIYKKLNCQSCHGDKGQKISFDSKGAIFATPFGKGYRYLKTVASPKGVFRVILLGIPPHMPSFFKEYEELGTENFAALSAFVFHLIQKGQEDIQAKWKEFQKQWEEIHPKGKFATEKYPLRYKEEISKRFSRVSPKKAKEKGCLACHEGIESMEGDNGKMGLAILALGGGKKGRSCVVCHEGNPEAWEKEEAHKNMFPDPGSMWVISFGKGCAKCHAGHNTLQSLQGVPFPDVPRPPMFVTSTFSDPTGDTGHSHVYRVQRSLMSLESGKASYVLQVAGFLKEKEFPYANFSMDDPLGMTPLAGSSTYKEWVKQAIQSGKLLRKEKVLPFPSFHKAPESWKKQKSSYLLDYYRKACGRCHLWHPGRFLEGEFRGSGCSACHVLYSRKGRYLGKDPTIPKDIGGHPEYHQVTAKVPYPQCSRCHMSLYRHSNIPPDVPSRTGYGPEVHIDRGMDCIDCHTSIDLHGDGNIYPSLQYQIETRCSDCHGTTTHYPWELPIGDWREGGSPRGVFRMCLRCQEKVQKKRCPKCQKSDAIREYLLTSRGNVRKNVYRQKEKVYLRSFITGKVHPVPLLKDLQKKGSFRWSKKYQLRPYHRDSKLRKAHRRLECSACHSRRTSKCYTCHLIRDEEKLSPDYVASPTRFDFQKGKVLKYYLTKGSFRSEKVPPSKRIPFWGLGYPDILPTLRGTLRPFQPVCTTFVLLKERKKAELPFLENGEETFRAYPLHVGKTLLGTPNAHEFTMRPRNCQECHSPNMFSREKIVPKESSKEEE